MPPARRSCLRGDRTLTCFANRAPPCTWFRTASGGRWRQLPDPRRRVRARAWAACAGLCVGVGGVWSEGARASCAPGERGLLLEMKKLCHGLLGDDRSPAGHRHTSVRTCAHTFSSTKFRSHKETHSIKQMSLSLCPQPLLVLLPQWA